MPASPKAVARVADPQAARNLLQAFFAKRSDLTVRNYRVDLVHFGCWWRAGGRELAGGKQGRVRPQLQELAGILGHDPTNDEREEFVAEVLREFFKLDKVAALAVALSYQNDLLSGALGRRFASQTVNHRIAALRAVVDLANYLGACKFNLDKLESLPKTKSRSTEGCGMDGYLKLLEQAERDVAFARSSRQVLRAARNLVLVRLMHDSALRRFEAIQARWPEDVDLHGRRIRFRRKKRIDKEWFDAISEDTWKAIESYLVVRGREPGYLLYGRTRDKPLDLSSVNRLTTSLAKRSEVDVKPHGLRHTAATTMLEETNGNVRAVAEFLGHSDTSTVQIYDDERQRLAKRMSDSLGEAVRKRRS